MKNKLRFILPRLIVLTAIAGLATLIIGTIFKLLLFGTVLFGIGSFAAARMRRRDRQAFKMDRTLVYPNVSPSIQHSGRYRTITRTKTC